MSQQTLARIANVLENQFGGLIDMSDWEGRPDAERRKAFLSRAVAALCVKSLANVDFSVAADAVTDGFHDNGIDAILFDQNNDTVIIVSSKWSDDGTKSFDADSSGSLVTGIRDLLLARFDRFNAKTKTKSAEVRAALYSERPIKFSIITAHTGVQPIAPFVKRKIDDLLEELNDTVQIADNINFDQAGIYGLITSESRPQKIKLQISLKDWGVIERPFLAYYGRVHVTEISQWWTEHGNALFTENLRLFYFNSDVNDALSRTLSSQPENFWYFNNGITVICDTLSKAPVGSPGRLIGLFTCQGTNIVNGAQTVGTIGNSVVAAAPSGAEEAEGSWVQVRIISLEKCPPDFARAITRAANLQNAVGNREFAAMDPVQHRLATDFALDKRRYVYKQGESDPKGEEGCDIVEATQALACASSIALTVQVKREIGALWADTNRAPYTDLFNDNLTSVSVWRAVLVMRAVDEELQRLKNSALFSADLIAVHLNRLLLHLVFQDEALRSLRHDDADEAACLQAARDAAARIFPKMASYIEKAHPDNYLASLSKNLTKCDRLARVLLGTPIPVDSQPQGELF
jgi:hypothetical protein